jgi:nucleotide-binding universal stress UspA family protein
MAFAWEAFFTYTGNHIDGLCRAFPSLEEDRKHAPEGVAAAARTIEEKKGSDLIVTTEIGEGSPKELIVEAAEKWGADLVVLGCHGFGRFFITLDLILQTFDAASPGSHPGILLLRTRSRSSPAVLHRN